MIGMGTNIMFIGVTFRRLVRGDGLTIGFTSSLRLLVRI
jgi:hypothetical protein